MIAIKILLYSLVMLSLVTRSLAQSWEWTLAAKPDILIEVAGISMLSDGLTGWATGNDAKAGRIYHTTDGWRTCEEQTPQISNNPRFRDVCFIDQFNGWIVGNEGIVLHTMDGGRSWEIQAQNLTSANLRKISAADDQSAVACGSQGTIIYTHDGRTWSSVKSIKTTNELMGINMYDRQHGIAVGKKETILYTTDGVVWNAAQRVPSICGQNFNAVCMIDERTAWLVGSGNDWIKLKSVLAKTTDGGETWTLLTLQDGIFENLWAIDFTNSNIGVAVGAKGMVLITQNGNDWAVLPPHFGHESKAVAIVDAKIWATSLFGTINYSEDLGSSWSILPHLTANFLYKICSIDDDRIMAVGFASSIVISEDGGLSWKAGSIVTDYDVSNQLWGIDFANSETGWVAGSGGFIAKTNSAGRHWLRQGRNVTDHWLRDVWSFDENNIWIVGNEGTILNSSDGGENWILQSKHLPAVCLYDIDGLDRNRLAIVGDKNTLLYTLDGGTTWLKAAHNLPGVNKIYSLDLVDASHAWAVGVRGVILFSSDAGASWSLQNSVSDLDLAGVHFKDSATGYLVGQNGVVFETTDGGAHWNRIAEGITDQDLKSIAITTDGKIFICGYNGVVLRYGPSPFPLVNPAKDYLPQYYYLGHPFPNPFNGRTNFDFHLPRATPVRIDVFNISGQLLTTLVNEEKLAGSHSLSWEAGNLASGFYLIRMKTENFTSIQKVLLVK